jgi:hypothetical protein
MKIKIIFGSILSLFLLLTLPSVQSIENNTFQELTEKIKNLEIENDGLKSKIINSVEEIKNSDSENIDLIEKISGLLNRVDSASNGNDFYLRFALIFFLFGCLFSIGDNQFLAKLYFRLSILYLILHLLLG